MYRLLLRLLLLLAASIPCASFAADDSLTIEDPYVRLAPPNAPATGAFMRIRNHSGRDLKLVKAESPAANTVELHNHINDNGVMKMRQVASIDVKSGGQAELKPGSFHVMLIGMKQPLKEGDSVPITLTFDNGSKKPLVAPVRKLQTTMPANKPMTHGAPAH